MPQFKKVPSVIARIPLVYVGIAISYHQLFLMKPNKSLSLHDSSLKKNIGNLCVTLR